MREFGDFCPAGKSPSKRSAGTPHPKISVFLNMPHCSFSQKLAARLFSALIWNREARHAFRNALLCDYKAELKALREQLEGDLAR